MTVALSLCYYQYDTRDGEWYGWNTMAAQQRVKSNLDGRRVGEENNASLSRNLGYNRPDKERGETVKVRRRLTGGIGENGWREGLKCKEWRETTSLCGLTSRLAGGIMHRKSSLLFEAMCLLG